MNLIHTPSSRRIRIMDTTLTALGWGGFLYLGLGDEATDETVIGMSMGTLALLLGLATLTFTLLLTAWSFYNQQRYGHRRTPDISATTNQKLAQRFHVSPNALDTLQDSRICVIHHDDEGEIEKVDAHSAGQAEPARLRLIA